MVIIKNFILVIALGASLNACVTSGGTQKQRVTSSEIHVHQTNGRDILTELDRNHWVSVRNSSKSDRMKLYSSLGTREWDVAITDARAYLQNHPKDLVALQVLAIGLSMKQNFSLASYYAKLIDKYHPGQVDTNNLKGLAILNQPGASFSDFRKAMVKFERSFEGDENQVASGLNLGHLHMEMGNADAARDVFKIVQDRCNNCEASLIGYGIAASRLKDYEQANDAFEKVLDKNPNHLQAKYYAAIIQSYGFRKNQKAVQLLSEVLDDKSGQHIEVKRKANFLMRRLEAQIYAAKKRKPVEEEDRNVQFAEEELETPDSESDISPVSDDI